MQPDVVIHFYNTVNPFQNYLFFIPLALLTLSLAGSFSFSIPESGCFLL